LATSELTMWCVDWDIKPYDTTLVCYLVVKVRQNWTLQN